MRCSFFDFVIPRLIIKYTAWHPPRSKIGACLKMKKQGGKVVE